MEIHVESSRSPVWPSSITQRTQPSYSTDTSSAMFIAALLTIARRWKHRKRRWCVYPMEFCPAVKMRLGADVLLHACTWEAEAGKLREFEASLVCTEFQDSQDTETLSYFRAFIVFLRGDFQPPSLLLALLGTPIIKPLLAYVFSTSVLDSAPSLLQPSSFWMPAAASGCFPSFFPSSSLCQHPTHNHFTLTVYPYFCVYMYVYI